MPRLSKQSQVNEIIKCGKDPVYFMNKYLKIQHPLKGLIRFNTFPFQDDCVEDFNKHRFNIILKSRQLGLSTLVAAYSVWQAIFYKEKNILIIATKLAVAQNFIRKVKTYIKSMPNWMLIPEITANNKQQVEFSNGSQIKAVPTSEDAGRSEALSLLIVDEAAFVRNFDELWMGLYPTLSTGGRAILLSTPNGVGGQYHEIYTKAERKENEFNPIKLMWDVHPERDDDWFDKETKNMSKKQVAQELLCDFASSGDTFITNDILENIRILSQHPIEKSGPNNNVWIWEYPLEGVNYVMSADIARGDSGDYSTFHIINTANNVISAEFKGKIPPDHFASLIYDNARRYNKAIVCPENNAYGYTTLIKLKELGYKNIYFSSEKEKYKFLYGEGDNIGKAGFNTNKESREKILANLEESLRNNRIKTKSHRLYSELKTFVWNGKKVTAMKGYNDDLIMSLAIGCWLTDNNSNTYNVKQTEMANALLQGMELNSSNIKNSEFASYYDKNNKTFNPFVPTILPESRFGNNNEITQKNPLGNLHWLVK
ncbi:MAG: hypothetical protein EBY39_11125 [Flavobacteriia bacterium]|nr:hypothetical protein [Flavobacteriia bacterium]